MMQSVTQSGYHGIRVTRIDPDGYTWWNSTLYVPSSGSTFKPGDHLLLLSPERCSINDEDIKVDFYKLPENTAFVPLIQIMDIIEEVYAQWVQAGRPTNSDRLGNRLEWLDYVVKTQLT
ncbi:unnamed protein product [Echinostoma caproni]|uniref:DUF4384 domain-containing protein n=1 Tax=Echinostoma caproni TaxID=27848 RepID=A0A183AG09_9TREM|nr:unnamed protein product [Echinostoma caproni]